jgi:hypothetical protein
MREKLLQLQAEVRSAQETSRSLTKLAHYPEVMLGVLIEILRLDGLATTRRLLSQGGVPLIGVARVRCQLSRIAELTNPLRSRSSLWRLPVLVTLRPEGPSARTLVQDILRFLSGVPINLNGSVAG